MCTFLQKQARPEEQQGGNEREEKRREMCRDAQVGKLVT